MPREPKNRDEDPTFYEPGEKPPPTKIVFPDGSVVEGQDVAGMTDADFAAMVDLDDDDELRAAYEATGNVPDEG